MMKHKLRSLICLIKGHKLKDEPEFRIYIRDGSRFKYNGRLFKCRYCGAFCHVRGLRDIDLKELIEATLKSVPSINCWKNRI